MQKPLRSDRCYSRYTGYTTAARSRTAKSSSESLSRDRSPANALGGRKYPVRRRPRAKKGIRLALEPLNRFETDFLHTVEQAMTFLARVDRESVWLLLDTFHLNIEEISIPNALRRA
jgi:hydroxypyruvate isomerase